MSEVASKRTTDTRESEKAGQASPSSPETPDGKAGGAQSAVRESVTKALSEFVAALVKADGGELYLVTATTDDVHLHLTGTCAGCPGATMTRERLLEPAVHGAAPSTARANVKVTTGWRVPEGATRIE